MTKLYAERPGQGEHFDYDEGRHLFAYRYAATLARGKRVLDAGCGEGFCTQALADVAASVVGADYHAEAVETARRTWRKPNLTFRVADLARESPGAGQFDLVVNFQVLEHIPDEIAFLRNLASALAPGGALLLTTPNVRMSFSENPCHLREDTAEQLRALLGNVFGNIEMKGVFGNAKVVAFDRERRRAVERILRLDPLGVRNWLPEKLVQVAFAQLGQVVRRQAHKAAGRDKITPDDFEVRDENVDASLDLMALCRL